jgi:hypothetical protein
VVTRALTVDACATHAQPHDTPPAKGCRHVFDVERTEVGHNRAYKFGGVLTTANQSTTTKAVGRGKACAPNAAAEWPSTRPSASGKNRGTTSVGYQAWHNPRAIIRRRYLQFNVPTKGGGKHAFASNGIGAR